MVEPGILITNNKMVLDNLSSRFEIIFVDGLLMDVLKTVRDYIHKGHRLLTHPLMGSIKPNVTPFKTVLISKTSDQAVDVDSLILIENSIAEAEKFLKNYTTPYWTQKMIDDFSLIDYDLMRNAIY